ncbi:cytochrome c1 [Paracoccaceae bacterium GXU_MW_L88]
MFKKTLLAALATLGLATGAQAAGGGGHVTDYDFSFEGPFGTFDTHQLQRGLQVYTEVCSACHGLRQVPIRTLGDAGGPHMAEEQVKAYASQIYVTDPNGDERPAEPNDHFPAVTAADAPDLSLMAKGRAGFHGPYGTGIAQLVKGMGGPEYIASLLTGYTGEELEQAGTLLYENEVFEGGYISMAPPLSDGLVEYQDGTEATVEQMALDVSAFLMWTAEPKLQHRKSAGVTAVIFLGILAVLLYFTNKKLWAPIKRKTFGGKDTN